MTGGKKSGVEGKVDGITSHGSAGWFGKQYGKCQLFPYL